MRLGIIGLGNAASTLHLPALAGLKEHLVVGATDLDAARRDAAGQRWRIKIYDDAQQLFAESKPEVVIVTTPPDSHATYCLQALEAGAHVICEKPFVASVAEADDVISAASRLGRRVALNHEFRDMTIFRAVRDAMCTPRVGDLVFAQAWQNMDLPPWKEPGWRGQMLQRTLYEAGVHLVDFLIALFGERPRTVSATVSSCGRRDSDSDAVALVTLEFSDGRLAQVVQNRLCRGETQYFEVRAEGTEASVRASFGGRARLTAGLLRSTRPHARVEWGASGMAWLERGTRRTFLGRNARDPGMQATRTSLEQTLAGFASDGAVPTTAEDGRTVLEVIAACYHSAENGRRVSLDEVSAPDIRNLRMGAVPRS